MSELKVQLDASKFLQYLKDFGVKTGAKTLRSAIRKSLNLIKKQAVKNLRGAMKNPKLINKTNKTNTTTLQKGIIVSVAKKAPKGTIHIHSGNGFGNFVNKFFELGTQERTTKSGVSRGRMEASHFFTRAIEEKKTEANRLLNQSIKKAIEEAYNKNK